MKKIIYILLGLITLLIATSCDKYLTVNPKTELPQSVLFSTQGGFKDALTGVYIQLKSNNSYGQNLSMTTIEQLISNWDVVSNSTAEKIGQFNYVDASVDQLFTSIYAQQYTTISSVNAILAKIDENKSVFTTPGMYELIKGECLAIRAFCHFDILRMWGPIPLGNVEGSRLPYVTSLSKAPNIFASYSEFKNLLLKDIEESEALLKDVDPIVKFTLKELGNPGEGTPFNPSDDLFAYRYIHMNYYAVKALQARAYLWFNNKNEAYNAARIVIEALNPDGSKKFRLGVASDFSAKDYTLTCEQIFGIYDFNLNTKYNTLFANGTLKKSSTPATVTIELYGSTGTDIREVNLWQLVTQANASQTYICQKYNVPAIAAPGFADLNRIPLLRLSEMYLVAIETAPNSEAQTLWDAYRTSRNIAVSILDPALLPRTVLGEYRKEFLGEGQAFYAYKRMNSSKTDILWAPVNGTPNYVLPLPKSEIITSN